MDFCCRRLIFPSVRRDAIARDMMSERLNLDRAMVLDVLDSVPVPLVVLDDDLRIQFSNPAFKEKFGIRANDVDNRTLASPKIGDDAIHELRRFAIDSKRGDTSSRVFDITIQSGGLTRVMLMEARRARTEARAIVLTMIDVTERLATEARIRELQAEHHDLSRLAAMSELATTIAHELNQPLSAAKNYARACAQTLRSSGAEVPDESYEMIDRAINQIIRAAEIIRNLRNYIEQGDMEFAAEDMERVVREAIDIVHASLPDLPVRIEFDCARGLPPVLANRVQIQQVVMNLVRNAVEAMESALQRVLTITIMPFGDGGVQVTMADTGVGLPEEISGSVFDPFVSSKDDGLGMGLAICRTSVRRHGGEIWAENNGGSGSVFRFTLPGLRENGGT